MKRQVKKYLGLHEEIPEHLFNFLKSVNQSYMLYDSNRELVERAMRLSGEELFEKNAKLFEEAAVQRALINNIKDAIQTISPEQEIKDDDILRIGEILTNTVKERKEFEKQLEEARENAEQSLETRKLFLANISHEIRTPINAISGMSGILADTDISETQKQYVKAIQSSSKSLMVIVNDILDMSKLESGKFSADFIPFDIRSIVDPLYTSYLLRTDEKGISFNIDYPKDMPRWVFGDPTRLGQILNNLISNAIKFTDKGSVSLKINFEKKGKLNDFCFTVTDTGIGIDQEKLKTIFEFFSQEDNTITRRFGGTGLGLAISKSIAELLGGEIKVESEKNVGSTFKFSLTMPEAAEQEKNVAVALSDLTGKNVLIVEDNELNRFLAVTILKKWNANIHIAENGEEAVAAVKNKEIDIVLMDIQMPVMDGVAASIAIRNELNSNVPIIALTANALESEKEKCWQAGMNEYITKPYNPNYLLEKIIFLIENAASAEEQNSEHVSLESLSELMNGSKEQMIQMTTVFLDQIERHFNELKFALNENNLTEISHITHKLKSSFKLFGLNKTGGLLERIEQKAKTLERKELHAELQVILSMQPRLTFLVQKELNQLIASNKNS
ncbi:MAG: ATP-binding protein [Flavobacteriales bacterium]|nr:ATP-binding protein [Flavobacteriales bacterium]MDP4731095.1 ATP-binding protein [Flavobacteriales bacterium]MDP4818884.1 ATP-binding protein [Flavobacteriales bacterium]